MDSLDKDIKFLKCLYDAVRTRLPPTPLSSRGLHRALPGRGQQERFRRNRMKDVFMERCKTLQWETMDV